MVEKTNKCCLKTASVLIQSHSILLPVALIFKSVFVCLSLMLNHYVKLYSYANNPCPLEKRDLSWKMPVTLRRILNSFYSSMIDCIKDFRITLNWLCIEILWCRPNLVRSDKAALIQSDTELDPENPISPDIRCLIIKLLLHWSQTVQYKSFEFRICKAEKY